MSKLTVAVKRQSPRLLISKANSWRVLLLFILTTFLVSCETTKQTANEVVNLDDATDIDDEDELLLNELAVQDVVVIPQRNKINLTWTNPSAPVSHINISWTPVEKGVLQPIIVDDISDVDVVSSTQSMPINRGSTSRDARAIKTQEVSSFAVSSLDVTPLAAPPLDVTPLALATPSMRVSKTIEGLTDGQKYTFYIIAVTKNADNKEIVTPLPKPIERIIGPNLDNDTYANIEDEDIDGDDIPNDKDPDDDNDGVEDIHDAFADNPAETNDTDGDGVGDNSDAFPNNASASADTDGDGIDDTLDMDTDNDGVNDEYDAYPFNNNTSYFQVANLRIIPAANRALIMWSNPSADIKQINISWGESDSPTVQKVAITDHRTLLPETSFELTGLTNDAYYNFSIEPSMQGDDEGKLTQAVKVVRAVGLNFDKDEFADIEDTDDDNDGTDDVDDAFPLNSAEDTDTDKDKIGNNADPDDDNDGTEDIHDAFPLNSTENADTDSDSIGDNADIDDDGDGLIEITTAAELNQIRYNLQGASMKESAAAVGNSIGCGNGANVNTCSGYELSADIDLVNYTNWQPLGSCVSVNICSVASQFNAIFDGNGFIVSNVNINATGSYGAGLFGAISSTSILRNIRLRDVKITGTSAYVGMLVGYAAGGFIHNSSAQGEIMSAGSESVGGLVGRGRSSEIISSYVVGGDIVGGGSVGGLVGDGAFARITSSYAAGGDIRGINNIGGLVGRANNADITASYAEGGAVIGQAVNNNVGGLVGLGNSATIAYSYAAGGIIQGNTNGRLNINGLVGRGVLAMVSDSYWDMETSGLVSTSAYGQPKTTVELQEPSGFISGSIYENWVGLWCNPVTGEFTSDRSSSLAVAENQAWQFGTDKEYPALTCTPGGVERQSGPHGANNLRVIPDIGGAELLWNNPKATISEFSIYYGINNSSSPLQQLSISNLDYLSANQINVSYAIAGLTSGEYYKFIVVPVLGGDDKHKKTLKATIARTIGSNFDKDGFADVVDIDDDNDGTEDIADAFPFNSTENTDTDKDKTGNNADSDDDNDLVLDDVDNCPLVANNGQDNFDADELGDACDTDDDNDGTEDIYDALPFNSTENTDTDKDKIGNNADTDDDGDLILDGVDNCPLVQNDEQSDLDADTLGDACDIDDDGDGLIEVITAAELNQIRHDLQGTSIKESAAAINNRKGCSKGASANTCSGYELSADIDLANYTNWQPLGSCVSVSICSVASQFNAIFDGNGFIVSNVNINATGSYGAGLFGAISSTSILRNIQLHDVKITGTSAYVGMLAGYADGGLIHNSSAQGDIMSAGSESVGGLVGYGRSSEITSSYVVGGDIVGGGSVGGLVGDGTFARIFSSYAVGGDVSSTGLSEGMHSVGGLIGNGNNALIRSSYAAGGDIRGINNIGGLVGMANNADITASYAEGGAVIGQAVNNNVGGLVGLGNSATIDYSYAAGGIIQGDTSGSLNINGLIGGGVLAMVNSSYWDMETSGIASSSIYGQPKTTAELQGLPGFVSGSIYEHWAGLWCNPVTGEFTSDESSSLAVAEYRVWQFGTDKEYPALTCTPGGVEAQSSPHGANNLRVIPDIGGAELLWNNSNATIRRFSIYYGINNSSSPLQQLSISDSAALGANQINVSYTIAGLTNDEYYKFVVVPVLGGDDKHKKTLKATIVRAIGSNFDKDGFADIEDTDDDNDGTEDIYDDIPFNSTEDTDTDKDDIGNNADPDDDNDLVLDGDDNCPLVANNGQGNFDADELGNACDTDDDNDGTEDIYDDLPFNSTENTDTDKDKIGNNADPDDDNDLVLDGADNCPLVQNDEQSNLDDDTLGDVCEIDDDGDGLIEITTVEQLNQIRYNLQGTSMKESASATGSSIGCGNGADVIACSGYEMSANIDLANYTNWQPIGDCVAGGSCPLAFNGTFEGNGHTISNLRISINGDGTPVGRTRDIGLFGAISTDSVVRGVHLRESSITIQPPASNVGMLVGYADNKDSQSALISNSSVTGNITSPSASQVGSLVGLGNGASIHSSYAESVIITGRDNIGGLVGGGNGASINSSHTESLTITGGNNIGGLVGRGNGASVHSSYAEGVTIAGGNSIGGLVGSGIGAPVHSSYAENVTMAGRANVGGLIGAGYEAPVHSSYVKEGAMRGSINIGGLIGAATSAIVNSSYASDLTVAAVSRTSGSFLGGLLGSAEDAIVHYSYVQRVKVTGPGQIGGLIGTGDRVLIQSSYARDSSVTTTTVGNGNDYGGLAGRAWSSKIIASYTLNVNVSGIRNVGGLLGDGSSWYTGRAFLGPRSQIISSYARGGIVKGDATVGGLAGIGSDMLLDSSYATTEIIRSGSRGGLLGLGGLAAFLSIPNGGAGSPGSTAINSYWDTVITKVADRAPVPDSFEGAPKTTAELQNPVGATGIYAGWANFWCNPDTGEFTSDSNSPLALDKYKAWQFGTIEENPALTCAPNGFTSQYTPIGVRNLRGFPHNSSITLEWDNPPVDIGYINVSYGLVDMLNAGAAPQEILLTDANDIAFSQKGVTINITGLINRQEYKFMLRTAITGLHKDRPIATQTLIKEIDFNYDGDELGNNADPDDDNDGTDDVADAFPFNITEDTDTDSDVIGNNADVDDDGDGLIEIANADELNQVRFNLRGTALKSSADDVGSSAGCGNGVEVTACNGYEVIADIDLAKYSNWQPIGVFVADDNSDAFNSTFNGIFNGNGWTISHLTISASDVAEGIGLFGAVSEHSILRDVHIRGARISGGANYIGMLAGSVRGVELGASPTIFNSSATGDIMSPLADSVGGLVGGGALAIINSSYVKQSSITGNNTIGGLLGDGEGAQIISSHAMDSSVTGNNITGSLVGDGRFGSSVLSFVTNNVVNGVSHVGGIVGYGKGSSVVSNYAKNVQVNGIGDYVGGLVGYGLFTEIMTSYVTGGNVRGDDNVGGIVGYGDSAIINASYVVSASIQGDDNVGGLVGKPTLDTEVFNSYWNNQSAGFTARPELSAAQEGAGKTTAELQNPVSAIDTGIYAGWDNFWCNPDTGEFTSDTSSPLAQDSYQAWRFGSFEEYPVLSCTSDGFAAQYPPVGVRNLHGIPHNSSITLVWDNPPVAMDYMSISYGLVGQLNAGTDPQEILLADANYVDASEIGVTINITGLINQREYKFIVEPVFTGVDKGRAVITETLIKEIDFNYDGDGLGNNADPDDDNDGTDDIADALPFNSDESTDADSDGTGDNADVDGDGNGLIEIATADELNQVRFNLQGTSLKSSADDVGSSAGCGNGVNITACNGYEVIADIDLSGYDNWQPIGTFVADDSSVAFNSTFNGNGWTISRLTISASDTAEGIGLFGAVSEYSTLRDVHIRAANITGGANYIGMLVGSARGVELEMAPVIFNSSVTGDIMSPLADNVGGLVGDGALSTINSSYVMDSSVTGNNVIGGLVGNGEDTQIISSYAMDSSIAGNYYVGGLVGNGAFGSSVLSFVANSVVNGSSHVGGIVGYGERSSIVSNYARNVNSIGDNVGGLVGYSLFTEIKASYIAGGNIIGNDNVGGLVGYGDSAIITASYLASASIQGNDNVGGLVGYGGSAIITASYLASASIQGNDNVGALIGEPTSDTEVFNSYWNNQSTGLTARTDFSAAQEGIGKTTAELQNPVSATGIYADWSDFWCDPDTGEFSDDFRSVPAQNNQNAWRFGSAEEYPVLSCTSEGLAAQYPPVGVSNLRGIPHNSSITLVWDNPPVAMDFISVSYGLVDTLDAGTTPQEMLFAGANVVTASEIGATINITGLINQREYKFIVKPVFTGINKGRAVIPQTLIKEIDSNYDGDELGNNADPDDDNDGIDDVADALPFNSDESTDADSDGTGDNADIDGDGNGLIEIATADELHQVRFNLQGTSLKSSADDIGSSAGCGDGVEITVCNGYELVADIDLSGYNNWQPIGTFVADDNSAAFSGAFNGNGWTISHLTISASDVAESIGLFGAVVENSILQNVHIRAANITGGANYIGMLVGSARGFESEGIPTIFNSSAIGEIMSPLADSVGGLVGDGAFSIINSSYVIQSSVIGNNIIGGLVGDGEDTQIISSYVEGGSIAGNDFVGGLVGDGGYGSSVFSFVANSVVNGSSHVGGLVGYGEGSIIVSNYVRNVNVSSIGDYVGGLVGYAWFAEIMASYVVGGNISGNDRVGGLVGDGYSAIIDASYVAIASIQGNDYVGGLVGDGYSAIINASYVAIDSIQGNDYVGGLVGKPTLDTEVFNSYWNNQSTGFTARPEFSAAQEGVGKTTAELQNPVSATDTGIYAGWANFWCNPDTGEFTSDSSSLLAQSNRQAWRFGSTQEYPSLFCTP